MSSTAVVATSFALITTLGVPSLITPVDSEVGSESQVQPSVIEESPQVQNDDRGEDDLEELYENPDLPVITALDPQTVFGADTSSDQSKIFEDITFSLPDACITDINENKLICNGHPVVVQPTAIDSQGQKLQTMLTTESDGLIVGLEGHHDSDHPIIVTIYITENDHEDLAQDAEDALAWMIAADTDAVDDNPNELDSEVDTDSTNSEQATTTFTPWPTKDRLLVNPAAGKRPRKVTVPSNYRYCPNSCRPKARHDYCTSPAVNFWTTRRGTADFRGPCARHDLMIDRVAKKRISLQSKRAQRSQGDLQFRGNLQQNCRHGFYKRSQTSSKLSCFAVSGTYWAAVSYRTRHWNGR